MRRLAMLGSAALVTACGGKPAEPSRPVGPVPVMAQHFETINRVQGAVIAGDLAAARAAALDLAGGLRDADHPAGWHGYLQDVRKGAWTVARAPDVATAARGASRAAAACGRCHAALRIVVARVEPVSVAPRTGKLDDFMDRHRWAIDRMWVGIVAPSETAWRDGARAVGEAGVFPLTDELRADPTSVALADRLAVTATRAAAATSSADRAQIYGELIGECAACHSRLGDVID